MYLPEDATINNIVCYLRRSRQDIARERRTGEDTLAAQRKLMVDELERLKTPYDIAEEIGSGDKIETRPVFQQVIKELKEGKYDAIAVKEIPRLGRGTYTDMGQIYDLIVNKRIFILTPFKTYDPQNSADLRQIRFELFLAREEFEMTRERLIGARYTYAKEGKWVAGSVPYGYRLNQNTMRLEPYEEEAKVVRLIFDLFNNGLEGKEVSHKAIATYLTRLGITSPGRAARWNFLSVKRILENEVYIGTVKFRTSRRVKNRHYERPQSEWIVVPGAHQPIIDKETWEKARAKINLKNTSRPHVKMDFSPCELAGLVVCAKCGKHMIRQLNIQHYRKKTGGTSVYHKEFLFCPNGCGFVKYRDVEAGILNYLEQLGEFDVQKLTEMFNETYNAQKEAAATLDVAEAIEQKKAELRRRLNFICEKYEAGIYDDQTFLERQQEIKREMALLENIPQNNKTPDDTEREMVTLKENIKTFLAAYHAAKDKTAKNNLLRGLISAVYLTKTGKGKFNLEIYPLFSFTK
ncbi:recombinase family protein [Neomoorella mulderi]|uniref:Recombinase n=1 Tax=Moorella mulderi DSM 14980 TaxID=1122241 RepID=A0A151ATJ9_9FIRM|nr:recombinase family protein [Moorella mulderi]KYH30979.1 recombinase [Moorella mulderi DSM 14980]